MKKKYIKWQGLPSAFICVHPRLMGFFSGFEMHTGIFARLVTAALVAAVTGACTQSQENLEHSLGRYERWAGLIGEVRAFERRIGFNQAANVLRLAEDAGSFPFCGRAPRLYLPYSYEDPAIRWSYSVTEQECSAAGDEEDRYFGTAEAPGEIAGPPTRSLPKAPLERFLYLVIHRDCHDQFDLPAGIEEALCNVIAHQAMAAFAKEKFGAGSPELRAITVYVSRESNRSLLTRAYYRRLASLYARYERRELPEEALLRERDLLLRLAERVLARAEGSLNNVSLAADMTYDRHYALVISVHELLGSELAPTVAFFRRVDALKPGRDDVMLRRRLADAASAGFVRAYEEAVLETIRQQLDLVP